MTMLPRAILALTAALFASGAALASPVSFDFSGTTVSGGSSAYPIGAPITGTVTLDVANGDPAELIAVPGEISAELQGADTGALLVSYTVSFLGTTYGIPAAGAGEGVYETFATQGPPDTNDGSSSYSLQALIGNNDLSAYSFFGLSLTDSTGGEFYAPSGAPPVGEVLSVVESSGEIVQVSSAGTVQIPFVIDAISQAPSVSVPAPASAGLLLIGLLGLARRRQAA